MKIFGPLYERAIQWSKHPRAPALLTGLSFVEAIIFPVPPEVMLAPMSLAQPRRALWFATLSLVGSLLGALIGYALGHFAFELVKPLLESLGKLDEVQEQVARLRSISPWEAFWLLVLAGFTPVPLKVFTWASGFVGVPLLAFIPGMTIGRGKRVYLVAGAIKLGGARAEAALHRWIEPVGWVASGLLVVLIGWLVWKANGG